MISLQGTSGGGPGGGVREEGGMEGGRWNKVEFDIFAGFLNEIKEFWYP